MLNISIKEKDKRRAKCGIPTSSRRASPNLSEGRQNRTSDFRCKLFKFLTLIECASKSKSKAKTMQYFDLNIPYTELPPSDKTAPDKSIRKRNRLKLVVKAMELGYAGVAYNRSIKGLMSESDRCSISLFPLSSLLSLSPSLSSAASFHRLLLGLRPDSRFRQYTRLTVSVDTAGQATSLNSGNPILKTYDLVAARPMNQNAFDQVCQYSEVDLIAIDFSDRLPFRLKLPMVKAAISRGVYFEITYSGLLDDVQLRRQLISNAKLLVDWTRGKNLIVSSAAPSVLEFRGPNDVANLLSLLGLATEHAKAAISKNCRSLIANAIRKKKFHKETIKVELMPSGAESDSKKPWFDVTSLEWDPISSGEGDLLLEDLAKSFSKTDVVSKSTKALDFDLFTSSIGPNGLKIKDLRPQIKDKSCPSNSPFDIMASTTRSVTSCDVEKVNLFSGNEPLSLHNILAVGQEDVPDTSQKSSFSESMKLSIISKATDSSHSSSTCKENFSRDPDKISLPSGKQDWPIYNSVSSWQTDELNTDNMQKNTMDVVFEDSEVRVSFPSKTPNTHHLETPTAMMIDNVDTEKSLVNVMVPSLLNNIGLVEQSDPPLVSPFHLSEDPLGAEGHEESNIMKTSLLSDGEVNVDDGDEKKDIGTLLSCEPELLEELPEEEKSQREDESEGEADIHVAHIAQRVLQMDSSDNEKHLGDIVAQVSSISEEVTLEGQLGGEKRSITHDLRTRGSKSAKDKIKQRGMRSPFKHFLQVPFKRKVAASRLKIKKR